MRLLVRATMLVAGLLAAIPAMAAEPPLIIGSGNIMGVYFPTAGAICRRVREVGGEAAPPCRELASAGSGFNLSMLRRGFPVMNMAVVQGDTLYHAVRGEGTFERDGPDRVTRSVMAMATEAFNIVARTTGFGEGLSSLRGFRVSAGASGSGLHSTVDAALAAADMSRGDFRVVRDFNADGQAFQLCRNAIDAFFFVAATPSASVQEATTSCSSTLVSPGAATIDRLVGRFPYYLPVVIPGGVYRGNPEPVATFGVPAILVTRANMPADVVYTVVKSVMDDLPAIRRLHPALADLEAGEMVPKPELAPIHPGALRYFREKGLLE
ncbi:MAG TPA: TAXI family TRAP transporter solute-binding subunit [Geminicoccaceae bacterium]|nr:TAXI family TRAP transporter solute-binding subunit [Geminicoccus sp.]HMU48872.1 TAXI family TRAP transporter solute-binding subunit [Geminicoccaceae bacterium]